MEAVDLKMTGSDYSKKVLDGVLSGQSFYDACRHVLLNGNGEREDCNGEFRELLNLIGCEPNSGLNKPYLTEDLQGVSKLRSVYKRTAEDCGFLRDKWRKLLFGCKKYGVEVDADELRSIRNMGYSEHQQCHLLYNLFVARGISDRTARMLVSEICKVK